MGLLYVLSVTTGGALAVLLLARGAAAERRQRFVHALGRVPGFSIQNLRVANGAGLALDRGASALCIVSQFNSRTRVDVVPAAGIRACEIRRNGRRVTGFGTPVSAGDTVPGELRSARQPRANDTGESIVLCLATARSPQALLVFELPDMGEAVRWYTPIKRIAEQRAPASPKVRSAAQCGAPAVDDTGIGESRQASRKTATDPDVRTRLYRSLSNVIRRKLRDRQRVRIPERKLRDECGVTLPIPHFHAQMNRFRREKAFSPFRLTYSRKDETWTIRKDSGRSQLSATAEGERLVAPGARR